MSKRSLFTTVVLGLLIVSCGLNNTMYNARKYFRSAQARPLNSNGKPTPQAIDEYTKTIQKCGVIITERKGSKIIDDALYLLARALYYKGNSAFQAKDQFEALIKGFPQSPHYPEAHIYLARVLRQINQPQEAEKLLEGFVRDTRYLKFHPRALMVLAEFEIGDKDYLRAQYWLQRIITDYPGTAEFKEANFLFGKNYYEQKDFTASLNEFVKLVDTRGISKELRLEGRYYIALNHFELGDLERSAKIVTALINDESRPDKLGQIRVLKARLLLAGSEPSKGITEVDDLAKVYPRSMSSAAAYYYLGDHHFYRAGNVEQAITAYNKVRTEFPSSELVTASQAKVAALNQLKLSQNLSVTGNLQQYVDYHMLAADNYLTAFALPDSALLMYDRVLQAPAPVKAKLDSLIVEIDSLQVTADSIKTRIADLESALAPARVDSTSVSVSETEITLADTTSGVIETIITDSDTTKVDDSVSLPADLTPPDSLAVEGLSVSPSGPIPDIQLDSVDIQTDTPTELPYGELPDQKVAALPDSVGTQESKPSPPADPRTDELQELKTRQTQYQTKLASLDTSKKELEGIITRMDTEILPLVNFAKASLLTKIQAPDDLLRAIMDNMETNFPENKYTNALRMLISGLPIRLADPEEDRQNELMDNALGLYIDQPDSMRVLLEELTRSQYSNIRLKASFRLAWMHSFELADTLAAKPYLDEVLAHPQGGDYATMARKFYDGKNFMFPKPTPDSTAAIDSLNVENQQTLSGREGENAEEIPAESLPELKMKTEAGADSLGPIPQIPEWLPDSEPDSLDVKTELETLDTPADPDSLTSPATTPAQPDSLALDTQAPPQTDEQDSPADQPEKVLPPAPQQEPLDFQAPEPPPQLDEPSGETETDDSTDEVPPIPAPPDIPPGEPELE